MMRYVFLALNWFFSVAFALLAIGAVVEQPVLAIILITMSGLLLPPLRNFIFKKTGKELSTKHRAIAITVLVIAFGYVVGDETKKQEEIKQAQLAAEELQALTADYNKNKQAIKDNIQSLMNEEKYEEAAALAAKYKSVADPDYIAFADSVIEKNKQIKLRKQRIESQFSAWDGSHIKLERYIKNIMNDPDSYDHVETVYWDQGDHLIVRTTFRGKNAFGGVIKDYIKARVDLDGNIIETFK